MKECGLTTLRDQEIREDQIELFKILNDYDRNICSQLRKIEGLEDMKSY